jgi:hypothetical protein
VASVERPEPTDEALRSAHAAIEYCYEQGWTDGLSVVPPLQELVDEFLDQTSRDPSEVLMTVRIWIVHVPFVKPRLMRSWLAANPNTSR